MLTFKTSANEDNESAVTVHHFKALFDSLYRLYELSILFTASSINWSDFLAWSATAKAIVPAKAVHTNHQGHLVNNPATQVQAVHFVIAQRNKLHKLQIKAFAADQPHKTNATFTTGLSPVTSLNHFIGVDFQNSVAESTIQTNAFHRVLNISAVAFKCFSACPEVI